MNSHLCQDRPCARLALLSLLLLGLVGGPAASPCRAQGPKAVAPSAVPRGNPPRCPQAVPVLAAWNWRAYFPDGRFEINQRRVIQIAALTMCLALYIIVWRNK